MPAPKGNQYYLYGLDTTGRPKRFQTSEEMQEAIDKYFSDCDNYTKEVYSKSAQDVIEIRSPKPYTIEGLCLALGILDRTTLLNYEKKVGYEDFFDIIKNAKMKIQHNKIENGLNGTYNCAVAIFDLKNNHGYKDKTETEFSGKLETIQVYLPDNGRNNSD